MICDLVEHDNPDRALCGKDVTGYPWNPPWPMCVVCVDLYALRATGGGALSRSCRQRPAGPP
jgi:hypothetical protein